MKTRSSTNWLVLVVGAVSLALLQTNQALGQCPISFTGPQGNVLNSSVIAYPNYDNGGSSVSSFLTTVQDGSPIPAGQYLTWCVDENVAINAAYFQPPGTSYSGLLYATCDSLLNTELPPGHTSYPLSLIHISEPTRPY